MRSTISILALSAVLGCPLAAHAQDKASAANAAAAEHFQKGRVAYDLQDWPTAITHFQEAYRLAQQPSVLWSLAQAQRQSGDCKAAIKSYKAFRRAGVSPEQASAADRVVGECQAQIEKDDAAQKAAAASASEKPPSETTKAAPEDGAASPPPSESPDRTGAFIMGGVTLVLAGGAVVTGLMAHDKATEYEAANDEAAPGSRDEREALRDDARTLQIVNTIFVGAAVVAGGVTAYLALSPSETPAAQHSRKPRTARVQLAPWVGPGGGGFVAAGSF